MGPKKNQQKMSLGTFLQDETLGSWADEMEDMPIQSSESRTSYGGDRRAFSSNTGMGMGRDMARDSPRDSGMGMSGGYSERRDAFPPREQLPLPTQPPYTAHIGNMSFETTSQAVTDFFKDCDVTNVRIVEDKIERKPKGFGYVEFATLDGLKTALSYAGSNLDGRSIRVSVADPPKDRQDGRDFSDWSRKGPLPDLPGGQRRVSERPGFAGRSFDNVSDAGSERGGARRNFEQGDGKVRDFSNWERKGPLSPSSSAAPSLRDGGRQKSRDGPGFRRASPAWGEGRSQDGSRPPRREYQDKPAVERAPGASEMDNQWRNKMRPDAPAKSPTPETSNPPSPAPAQVPTTRPKLNLQKRTVSEADPSASPASTTDAKASPFGAARPVDTATKEKEVEEKRQLAVRQKKEADDKVKADKAEEKRLAKEKTDAEKPTAVEPKEPKEPKEVKEADTVTPKSPQPAPKFDILRRADSATNDMLGDDDAEEEVEENAIVEDTTVKPKEIVRDAPAPKSNGAWRKRESAPKEKPVTAAPQTTTENMEEDGWSTVSKPTKQRNGRRGNQPARAIAS